MFSLLYIFRSVPLQKEKNLTKIQFNNHTKEVLDVIKGKCDNDKTTHHDFKEPNDNDMQFLAMRYTTSFCKF